jgi:hypothetical protein
MSLQVLRDCKLIVGKYDFSSKMNALALNYGAEALDDTTFASGGTKSNTGGLKTVTFQHEGLFDTGTGSVDEVFYGNIGLADQPVAISPEAGAEGELAYFFKSLQTKYSPSGKIGQLLAFSVGGEAQHSPLVRGIVGQNATRTATGVGTAYQLGAVSATQKLYAALHVLAKSGTATPSLVVKVQSASDQAFTEPNDRITFAAQTDANAVWATPVAGAITDTWWRVTWAITGTNPSFQFIVPVGIL